MGSGCITYRCLCKRCHGVGRKDAVRFLLYSLQPFSTQSVFLTFSFQYKKKNRGLFHPANSLKYGGKEFGLNFSIDFVRTVAVPRAMYCIVSL